MLKGAPKITKDRVAAFFARYRRRSYKHPSAIEADYFKGGVDHGTHQAELVRLFKRNAE